MLTFLFLVFYFYSIWSEENVYFSQTILSENPKVEVNVIKSKLDPNGYFSLGSYVDNDSVTSGVISRYSKEGLVLWTKSLISETENELLVESFSTTIDGGIVVVGNTQDDLASASGFVAKISSLGNIEWEFHIQKGSSSALSVFSKEDNFVIFGSYDDDLESGYFMTKLYQNGSLAFQVFVPVSSSCEDYVTCGDHFYSICTHQNESESQIILLKIGSDGDLQSSYVFGEEGYDFTSFSLACQENKGSDEDLVLFGYKNEILSNNTLLTIIETSGDGEVNWEKDLEWSYEPLSRQMVSQTDVSENQGYALLGIDKNLPNLDVIVLDNLGNLYEAKSLEIPNLSEEGYVTQSGSIDLNFYDGTFSFTIFGNHHSNDSDEWIWSFFHLSNQVDEWKCHTSDIEVPQQQERNEQHYVVTTRKIINNNLHPPSNILLSPLKDDLSLINFTSMEVGETFCWSCFGVMVNSDDVCNGNGKCISFDSCECSSGYTASPNCEMSCHGILPDNTSYVCNGHGNCTEPDKCTCDFPYSGKECESKSAFYFWVIFSSVLLACMVLVYMIIFCLVNLICVGYLCVSCGCCSYVKNSRFSLRANERTPLLGGGGGKAKDQEKKGLIVHKGGDLSVNKRWSMYKSKSSMYRLERVLEDNGFGQLYVNLKEEVKEEEKFLAFEGMFDQRTLKRSGQGVVYFVKSDQFRESLKKRKKDEEDGEEEEVWEEILILDAKYKGGYRNGVRNGIGIEFRSAVVDDEGIEKHNELFVEGVWDNGRIREIYHLYKPRYSLGEAVNLERVIKSTNQNIINLNRMIEQKSKYYCQSGDEVLDELVADLMFKLEYKSNQHYLKLFNTIKEVKKLVMTKDDMKKKHRKINTTFNLFDDSVQAKHSIITKMMLRNLESLSRIKPVGERDKRFVKIVAYAQTKKTGYPSEMYGYIFEKCKFTLKDYLLLRKRRKMDKRRSVTNKLVRNILQIKKYFSEIAKGLALLHQCGVSHMNLHLSNIMISNMNSAKIGGLEHSMNDEYGINFQWEEEEVHNRLCLLNSVFNDPKIKNEKIYICQKCDVYSFGLMLFCALVGETNPFYNIKKCDICKTKFRRKKKNKKSEEEGEDSDEDDGDEEEILECLYHMNKCGFSPRLAFPELSDLDDEIQEIEEAEEVRRSREIRVLDLRRWIVDLIARCVEQNPEKRPSFREILEAFYESDGRRNAKKIEVMRSLEPEIVVNKESGSNNFI